MRFPYFTSGQACTLQWPQQHTHLSIYIHQYCCIHHTRDAPIRHWPIIGWPLIGAEQSADCRLVQKNLFCCLLSVIYLGSDCYPRTLTYLKDCRVQTKQKHTEKQSYKTHPLLPENETTLMFQQMTYIDAYINFISATYSPHNAKMTIGRYQHTNRPIPIISQLSVHLYSTEHTT